MSRKSVKVKGRSGGQTEIQIGIEPLMSPESPAIDLPGAPGSDVPKPETDSS